MGPSRSRDDQHDISEGRVWTLPELAALTELPYRTLHSWLQQGLVSPSLRQSTGAGSANIFSGTDALRVRILADLRRSGSSLGTLSDVSRTLESKAREIDRDSVIVVNGSVSLMRAGDRIGAAVGDGRPALICPAQRAWDAVADR